MHKKYDYPEYTTEMSADEVATPSARGLLGRRRNAMNRSPKVCTAGAGRQCGDAVSASTGPSGIVRKDYTKTCERSPDDAVDAGSRKNQGRPAGDALTCPTPASRRC